MSRTARLAVSAAIVAFALAAILLARAIPSRHVRGDPGPGAFPTTFALIVLAGAAAAFLIDLRQPSPEGESARATLLVAAASTAYLVLMTVLGFVPATAVFLGGVSWYLDRERRHRPLAHGLVAVTTALVAWYIFSGLLDVVLPGGLFGI